MIQSVYGRILIVPESNGQALVPFYDIPCQIPVCDV